jgi:hypothetical protein
MNATIRKAQNMNQNWLVLPVILFISLFYWAGLADVPFHPDESTQIYMSRDLDFLITDIRSLVWSPQPADGTRQLYRLLDAPLARYLINIGRVLFSEPAIPIDWDWGKTFQQNAQSGALPGPYLLFAARVAVSFLFPFSLLLAFLTGKRTSGAATGWLFMLLIASNSLILLHTRRSMAESALLFSVLLFCWWAQQSEERAWILAIPAALSFSTKQSTFPLALVGLALVIYAGFQQNHRNHLLRNVCLFGILFGAVVFLLNPFLWADPFQALLSALAARQDLLARQVDAARLYAPGTVLDSLGDRLVALLGNLFLTPPAFAEVGNYLGDTRLAEQAYLANPFNNLSNGLIPGFLLLVFSFGGMVMGVLNLVRRKRAGKPMDLLLLTTFFQATGLLLTVPLPFQRYVIPLLPLALFWAAYAITSLGESIQDRLIATGQHPN